MRPLTSTFRTTWQAFAATAASVPTFFSGSAAADVTVVVLAAALTSLAATVVAVAAMLEVTQILFGVIGMSTFWYVCLALGLLKLKPMTLRGAGTGFGCVFGVGSTA